MKLAYFPGTRCKQSSKPDSLVVHIFRIIATHVTACTVSTTRYHAHVIFITTLTAQATKLNSLVERSPRINGTCCLGLESV